jgi:diguanylate cyclase (GGDEF)-like protein
MSFRARLTSFFVLIVVLPMIAVGVVVFRLIDDSQSAKASARAAGLASIAQSLYASDVSAARSDAAALARRPALLLAPHLQARLQTLLRQSGLARIEVLRYGRVLADVGDRSAIAPGTAEVLVGSPPTTETLMVSATTAGDYGRSLAGPGTAVVIRAGGRTLYSSLRALQPLRLRGTQTVNAAGSSWRVVTQSLPGFGGVPVRLSMLSNLAATASSAGASRDVAIGFIAGFLALALGFSLLASRALEGQLRRFLQAARRLAAGDFSSPVPVEGRDDFALLGQEFNNMSRQLERRLGELDRERGRLRESIRRIGKTFASNLDRPALLELALRASMDAVGADQGRLSARSSPSERLSEHLRVGSLAGLEAEVLEAERAALASGDLGLSGEEGVSVAAVTLAPLDPGGRTEGVITVVRHGQPFGEDESDLLRSLASQASLALENVRLHEQVSRQAVTDELTGLANHGRFHELLATEMEQVRRYRHPVGLIMLDIDDFKAVNDTYGHQQGDLVLREVARVLRQNSREADLPARYGGEELAVILPHTDLDGAYAIAERIRREIERLWVPRLAGAGKLAITASLGVAATTSGEKDQLLAEADAALYAAKRAGKNRTMAGAAPVEVNVGAGG